MQQLHVERIGYGKPVLLLHGLLSEYQQTLPLISEIKGFEIFAVDLIGCGESSKVATASIIEENVKFLRELCKEHEIKIVVAYSISGLIALNLRLPHTVFVSSFCSNPIKEGTLKLISGKQEVIEQYLLKNHSQIHKLLAPFTEGIIPGSSKADTACAINYLYAAKSDYSELAKKLRDVLVCHGTKDNLIDKSLGQQLAQLTNAELVLVPEDHNTILKNKVVHAAIADFVTNALKHH